MVVGRRSSGAKLLRWMLVAIMFLWSRPSSSSRPLFDERVVTHLPGFEGPLPFSLRTGYVEVDEANGVRLFYYFTPSERSPADDPVMLWLSGGPGCSSFTGLAYQIGPLGFDLHGTMDGHVLPKLVYRQESWIKVSNVIFLDSPIGAGFSYSVTKEGYISSDTKAVNQILIFLSKWFGKHPDFLSNPLYIGGDSYSGMIVPTVTSELAKDKHVGSELTLNLKGYLVGNPFTDAHFDEPSKIPFAHRRGLISDEIYDEYTESCGTENSTPQSIRCKNSLNAINECVKDIFPFHILEPNCDFASPHPYSLPKLKLNQGIPEIRQLQDDIAGGLHLSEISTHCRTPEYALSRLWANDAAVRDAIGVHKGTVPSWLRCHTDIPYSKDIPSSVKYHSYVISKGYRSLVYSGDYDMAVPYVSTESWIRSLNLSIQNNWRPWYVDGQVAGYTTSYSNNFTFATVKGAGHTAPEYMPRQCLAMVARWLAGEHL